MAAAAAAGTEAQAPAGLGALAAAVAAGTVAQALEAPVGMAAAAAAAVWQGLAVSARFFSSGRRVINHARTLSTRYPHRSRSYRL